MACSKKDQVERPARAVVAVIRNADDESFLVIKRAENIRAPGKICFPGGGIEPGESEHVALVREIKEEIGIDIDPLVNVYNSVTPWGVHVSWYTAKMLTHEILVDPQEVQWCRWLSEAEVRQHPDLLESNRQFFDALNANVFQLPDVTA